VNVLDTEFKGSVKIEDFSGDMRTISFRADRVDMAGEVIRFTDYKTGRPISQAVKENKRYEHFLNAVSRGEYLQGVAYALSEMTSRSEGRYLFLKPEIPEEARVLIVKPDDREIMEAFRRVVQIVLRAWDQGSFFPRLVTTDGEREPDRCRYCEVAQACLRGDSGARARLLGWIESKRVYLEKGVKVMPSEEAILWLWYIGSKG